MHVQNEQEGSKKTIRPLKQKKYHYNIEFTIISSFTQFNQQQSNEKLESNAEIIDHNLQFKFQFIKYFLINVQFITTKLVSNIIMYFLAAVVAIQQFTELKGEAGLKWVTSWVSTGRKLIERKMFRRRHEQLLNVLRTLNLSPVSRAGVPLTRLLTRNISGFLPYI